MRLTPEQQDAIHTAAVDAFGVGVGLWLFRSRVADARLRMFMLLERMLGERKIDVVVETPSDARPIVAIAHETGVRIR